jgi:type II secretion system protein L
LSANKTTLVLWWPQAHEYRQAEALGNPLRVRYEVHGPLGKLHGGVETLNTLPSNMPCLVLAAPSDVGVFMVEPPKLSGQKLQTALPFLVEPFLLNQPEENHVSLWDKRVAVIQKAWARTIVQTCLQAKLQVSALSCETLLNALQAEPTVWFSGKDLLCTDPHHAPWSLSTSQPQALEAMLLAHLNKTQASTVHLSTNDEKHLRSLLSAPLPLALNTQPGTLLEPMLQLLKKNLLPPKVLHQLGVKRSGPQEHIKQFAMAFGCLMVVAVLGLNALAFKYKQNHASIEAQIEKWYQEALPNTPMIADPLLLIQREKKLLSAGQSTAPQGISSMLHAVGVALDDAPFNSMTQISWNERTLSVEFSPNLNTSMQDKATQQLKTQGLVAKWVNKEKTNPMLQIRLKEQP